VFPKKKKAPWFSKTKNRGGHHFICTTGWDSVENRETHSGMDEWYPQERGEVKEAIFSSRRKKAATTQTLLSSMIQENLTQSPSILNLDLAADRIKQEIDGL
jgi:hypothetical protein